MVRNNDFGCEDCGSPSIKIDGPLTPLTPVLCGGCGRHLADWHDFVREVESKIDQRIPSIRPGRDHTRFSASQSRLRDRQALARAYR